MGLCARPRVRQGARRSVYRRHIRERRPLLRIRRSGCPIEKSARRVASAEQVSGATDGGVWPKVARVSAAGASAQVGECSEFCWRLVRLRDVPRDWICEPSPFLWTDDNRAAAPPDTTSPASVYMSGCLLVFKCCWNMLVSRLWFQRSVLCVRMKVSYHEVVRECCVFHSPSLWSIPIIVIHLIQHHHQHRHHYVPALLLQLNRSFMFVITQLFFFTCCMCQCWYTVVPVFNALLMAQPLEQPSFLQSVHLEIKYVQTSIHKRYFCSIDLGFSSMD